MKWTLDNLLPQSGKCFVVTGANSGVGYEAALALAGAGGQVILAVRSQAKGELACQTIRTTFPGAQVQTMLLDLADLESVRRFAQVFQSQFAALDVLINNAGVMALPYLKTVDGFEMQFGVNHLGHFALTGLLLPVLQAAPGARVVTVSSLNHNVGKIDFDNLDGARSYGRWAAYSQSKLANVLFAYELQRRLAARQSGAISVGCHPGYSSTNLQSAAPRLAGSRLKVAFWHFANSIAAQSAAMGALPLLYAACAAGVQGGDYIGPDGLREVRGHPVKVGSSRASQDASLARRLWEVSEELTGVTYFAG
jgi:NAD(P)-dependent dehydrogenase (short-subunit alcohol dehydrogenase family)